MGQIHEGGHDNNIFTCATCQFRVCIIHDTEWHEGETCEEYDLRTSPTQQNLQEKNSLEEVARISKKCPGDGCGCNIEKNCGCDHMTCEYRAYSCFALL
jgi:E3 ubiquitin-protein ligase RNF14